MPQEWKSKENDIRLDDKGTEKTFSGHRGKVEGSDLINALSSRAAEAMMREEKSLVNSTAELISGILLNKANERKMDNVDSRELLHNERKDVAPPTDSQQSNVKTGIAYTSLIPLIHSQCKWYLTGDEEGTTIAKKKNPALPMAHKHLVNVGSKLTASSSVYNALLPNVLEVPNMIRKPVTKSVVHAIPLFQEPLNSVLKINLDRILLSEAWRSMVKVSTTGYIEKQTK